MVKCENCIYSKVVNGDRFCLRFPPAVRLKNPAGSVYESVYPHVEDNFRCGEGKVEV